MAIATAAKRPKNANGRSGIYGQTTAEQYQIRRKNAVRWAEKQVNTVESGGDNRGTKIQAWQRASGGYDPGTAWCQIFVNNSFKAAVGHLPWYTKNAYTIDVYNNAPRLTSKRDGHNSLNNIAKQGWGKFTDPRLVQPGDWVYMYWPPSGQGHVGIAITTYINGSIGTVEGNTHRQSGGGKEGVWKKKHAAFDLHGYLRPPYVWGKWARGY